MNIPEETGKTISNVADALRGNPSCLAAILLAAMFAVLTYLSLVGEREDMQRRQMALIDRCQFLPPHTDPPFGENPE